MASNSRPHAPAELSERATACPAPLARRLHDLVAQPLCSVLLALGSGGPLDAAERRRCTAELERAISKLRALISEGGVQAPGGEPASLAGAVRAACDENPGVRVDLSVAADATVSADTQMLVQDFVSEALRNATKHARTTAIAVAVRVSDAELGVAVENDGVDPAAAGSTPGIGIELLRRHAAHVGGRVVAGAGVSGSWRIELVLPMPGSPQRRRTLEGTRGR